MFLFPGQLFNVQGFILDCGSDYLFMLTVEPEQYCKLKKM